jgi:hypothetical protein
MPVTSVLFVEHLPGTEQPWEMHRAPLRQLVIPLRGCFRVEASDGSSREFGPGDVVLAEDTRRDRSPDGPAHR